MVGYTDALYDRLFEGLPVNITLTDEIKNHIGIMNRQKEVNQISDDARLVFFNFVMWKPLKIMEILQKRIK